MHIYNTIQMFQCLTHRSSWVHVTHLSATCSHDHMVTVLMVRSYAYTWPLLFLSSDSGAAPFEAALALACASGIWTLPRPAGSCCPGKLWKSIQTPQTEHARGECDTHIHRAIAWPQSELSSVNVINIQVMMTRFATRWRLGMRYTYSHIMSTNSQQLVDIAHKTCIGWAKTILKPSLERTASETKEHNKGARKHAKGTSTHSKLN